MNSDLLTFSVPEVQNMVSGLVEIKNMIISAKKDYDEYVATRLKKQWNTAGGMNACNKLEEFSNVNIQKYIDSVQTDINNLSEIIPLLTKINQESI